MLPKLSPKLAAMRTFLPVLAGEYLPTYLPTVFCLPLPTAENTSLISPRVISYDSFDLLLSPRYLKRGVSDTGKVANDVEVEQVSPPLF